MREKADGVGCQRSARRLCWTFCVRVLYEGKVGVLVVTLVVEKGRRREKKKKKEAGAT